MPNREKDGDDRITYLEFIDTFTNGFNNSRAVRERNPCVGRR